MNGRKPWQLLPIRNVDVLSAEEAQMLSRSDEEQLQWALDNQRIIYSFNVRDFYRIHTNKSAEEMENQVEFLSAWEEQ